MENPPTLKKQASTFEELFINVFRRTTSSCLAILGRRQTGKTDLSLRIAEVLSKYEVIQHFCSNIKIYSSPFIIEHIINLEDLESWCKNRTGKKLFIFDEAGKSLRRRTPMSKLNIRLLDNLQILRKYKLNIIIIAPDSKYLDRSALGSDVLDAVILKQNFSNPKKALFQDLQRDNQVSLNNIQRTSIQFDTWDIAPFVEKSFNSKTPMFPEKDKQMLWEWANGKRASDIGLDRTQIRRINKKFLLEALSKERDLGHITREA